MRAGWLVAVAAGAAFGASAPAEVEAQGNSNRARQQQEAQRERERGREETRRTSERENVRRQRERLPAGIVVRRNDRDRDYDRRNERDRRDDRYDRDRRYEPWDVYGRKDDRDDRRGPAFCRSGEGHPVHGRQWCREKGFGLGREQSRDIWGDIIYRDRRYHDRRMDRSTLGDILGSVVLGRFDSYGRDYYGNESLNGRWLDNRATTLQLYMGSMPIARLIDSNRDGRVDSVSLMR